MLDVAQEDEEYATAFEIYLAAESYRDDLEPQGNARASAASGSGMTSQERQQSPVLPALLPQGLNRKGGTQSAESSPSPTPRTTVSEWAPTTDSTDPKQRFRRRLNRSCRGHCREFQLLLSHLLWRHQICRCVQ